MTKRKRSEAISKMEWEVAAHVREHGKVPMPKRRKRPVRAATRHATAKREGLAALGGYDVVLASQGGGCAICGRPPKPGGRRLDADHDHLTGTVRGLLCPKCNRMLGWARDNDRILYGAAIYLTWGTQAACAYRDGWQRTVTP